MSFTVNGNKGNDVLKDRSGRLFKPASFKTSLPTKVNGQQAESLKQQLEEKTRELRHKALRLLAAESENRVIRKNIEILTQDNARLREIIQTEITTEMLS